MASPTWWPQGIGLLTKDISTPRECVSREQRLLLTWSWKIRSTDSYSEISRWLCYISRLFWRMSPEIGMKRRLMSSTGSIQAKRVANQHFKHYQLQCYRKRKLWRILTGHSYVLKEVTFITFTHNSLALPHHRDNKCAILLWNRKAETLKILVNSTNDYPK